MSENRSIVAKFMCQSVTKSYTGNRDEKGNQLESESIQLNPVYGKDGTANAQWSKYTPSGELKMQITNPGAQDKIKPGKSYKITIEEVSEDF